MADGKPAKPKKKADKKAPKVAATDNAAKKVKKNNAKPQTAEAPKPQAQPASIWRRVSGPWINR